MKKLRNLISLRALLILFSFAFMIFFIVRSDAFLPSVRDGLNLYVTAVLPSMLPFFFFSKLLTELNFASDAGALFRKPLARLYHAPPAGAYILLMSFLCGYPVGSKLIGEFFSQGLIDKRQAKRILPFTSASGPLFIVGTVGVTMFDNKTYGVLLLSCHYLGALLNGLFYRGKSGDVTGALPTLTPPDDLLNKTMLGTVLSVALVGGYITLFNLLSDALYLCGLTPLLTSLLSQIGVNERISEGLLRGLVEMTKGCLTLSQSGFPPLVTLPAAAFLIGFGGLGVTVQSLTFLSKTKISPAYYLSVKCTQGILCSVLTLLTLFVVELFPNAG